MRWLWRGAVALVALAGLALVALLLIPTERVAQVAADRIGAATGRAVTIDGPVRATLWPRLGVRAEDVAVANAPWSSEGPMLRAASVEVGVGFGALLGGDVRIDVLEIDGARLLLERREDGAGNWEIGEGAGGRLSDAAPEAPAPRALVVDRAVLRNAEVTWIDRGAGRRVALRALDLETRLDGLDAPFAVTASALAGDVAVEVAARVEALGPLLDGAPTPVALTAEGGATRIALDGRADLDAPSFEGALEARSDDGFALLSALGVTAPGALDALGPAELTAGLTLAPAGTVHVRDMDLGLDGNRLTGSLDLDPGGVRPRVRAELAAETLDLTTTRAAGTSSGDASSPPRDAGWSRAPIDVSALFAVDGEVALASGPVTLDGAVIDELRARAAIEEGRAVIALEPLRAYGGAVTGEVVVNGRGGLSARADLDVTGLQLRPFLAAFAGVDRLAGAADLSVDLLAAGDTEQALMESLEGGASLRIGPGEVRGIDVTGMIRDLDPSRRGEGFATAFDGTSVSATISGGVARSDDLALSAAPYFDATGEGSADIGARTISYRLLPTVRAEAGGDGLRVPILIEGPWSDPSIRPDLEYLARERLDLERAELEARVREEADAARTRVEDELRQRLADELEVAPEALGSREGIEGAIRDRLQDQLLELLQGR